MRIGIIGGGTIARLFLEHIAKGDLGDAQVVAILGRQASERCAALAAQFAVNLVTDTGQLIAARPAVVVEAAGHASVGEHAEALLAAGIGVIVLSAGALADDGLRHRLEAAAVASGA